VAGPGAAADAAGARGGGQACMFPRETAGEEDEKQAFAMFLHNAKI